MATAMSVLAWLSIMLLLGFYFHNLLGRQQNPNQEVATRAGPGGAREVVLVRNRYGHYVTSGTINDRQVVFLLDTGATGVAIPAQVAARLGLRRGQASQVRTANGIGTAYATPPGQCGRG